ncbi:hypothetical protein [Streptomyces xanthii]|uniref:HEAT repeat domain-containing protein n=1 Tax=Streptomyces xanthii TaxID=2768069 RepID=A0A7H1BHG1_9ACTN|nr:hypothetical protein [Streptomyces xanthii]QNS08166.1 hypothetical protein IAG42_34160 [Streptomyces xanthii]
MNVHGIAETPSEHVRFAAYLDMLRHVREPDEVALVARVLADQDRTMARSAVLRHLDLRAADLCDGPAYPHWAPAMAEAVSGHPFLVQRLREWTLLRAVALDQPWQEDDLLASSDWLQLKAAAGSHARAIELLAERGRTQRIRNAARAGLSGGRPSRPRRSSRRPTRP